MDAQISSSQAGALLLDREGQFDAIERLLVDLGAGRGGAVAFHAPAGLGKTGLLDAAARRARARGMVVVAGRGSRVRRDDAWGLAGRLPAPSGPLASRLTPAVAEVIGLGTADAPPAGAAPSVTGSHTPPPSVLRVAEGLCRLVLESADGQPLLVCVDDAHWADPETLRFLDLFVEQVEGAPLALLLAARPDAEDDARALLGPTSTPTARATPATTTSTATAWPTASTTPRGRRTPTSRTSTTTGSGT